MMKSVVQTIRAMPGLRGNTKIKGTMGSDDISQTFKERWRLKKKGRGLLGGKEREWRGGPLNSQHKVKGTEEPQERELAVEQSTSRRLRTQVFLGLRLSSMKEESQWASALSSEFHGAILWPEP
jgi:hypothetical protein